MGKVIVPGDIVYAFAEATTWKTPMADNSAAHQLSQGHIKIMPNDNLREPSRAPGQRYKDKLDIRTDAYGALCSAEINAEAISAELDYWLYLMFQKVTEGESTPFAKVFTLPATSAIVDLGNNEGVFIDLWKKMPEASKSQKASSLIGATLELSLSAENNGVLMAKLGLKGIGHTWAANPSGTWTLPTAVRYNFHNATMKLATVAVILKSWTLTMNVELVPIGSDAAGNPQNIAFKNFDISQSIAVAWAASARPSDIAIGSFIATQLYWGTAGVSGHLDFSTYGMILPETNIAEGDTEDSEFSIKVCSDIATSTVPITITLANAIDRTW